MCCIEYSCKSNYKPDVLMNHIYFTALRDGAVLGAEIAAMLGPEGRSHTFTVWSRPETSRTRSYRTSAPLVVVEEIVEWTRLTPETVATWRTRLATLRESDAEIIN